MTELFEILYGVGAVGTGFVLARHLAHRFRGGFARFREREGPMRWLSIPASVGVGASFFLLAVMLWPAALIWLGWDRRDQERFEAREESAGYRRLVREIREAKREQESASRHDGASGTTNARDREAAPGDPA